MASRKDEICFKSFESAFSECPEAYGRIDLLCGGWPCQDNSIAGKRKGHTGKNSGLFSEFCRVLRIFNPRWFIGENVPGLLSVNAGKDFCQVLTELQDIGYGVSWRIFDSQYFGVAQKRRRLFIVGYFGNPCPPEILFESENGSGNHPQKQEMGQIGVCISTRDGERQDPSKENIIAFCVGTDLRGTPRKIHTETLVANTITQKETQQYSGTAGGKRNIIAKCLLTEEDKLRKISSDGGNIVGTTVRNQEAGNRIQGNIATTINPNREGEIAGIPYKLDAPRGVVIGNAVTVNVARWIGERIMKYEKSLS